ncbi:hypothetical protein HAP47_0036605 [Bradyrhizobium sp. 41S5]|uniref:hypothetical protein n=1 Tax=Bradyrhizobium sp. 41S5 TaxID=1404443 RepID=UPI00156B6CD4|nr:hypothetical protein [Bradyrhizobium sp. 41S5]UFX44453.1 hypothetical protein HAP47_0036605 [Bradyrhizobium sp. 41S5]
MTCAESRLSDHQEYFRGTLKTHVKVQRSRPVCWHFCWYRANERSRRISLFRTRELSRWPARWGYAQTPSKQVNRKLVSYHKSSTFLVSAGRCIIGWFETSFLGGLPQYQLVKGMGEGLAQVEDSSVPYLPAERIRPLNIPMMQAGSIVKHIGIGSGDTLRGKELTPPTESYKYPPLVLR